MLDPTNRFTVPGLDGVVFFGDDASSRGFYALPAAPRIALDEAGRPQLSLMVYGQRERSGFTPKGALLALTTTLGLTAAEERAARAALARRMAPASPGTKGAAPPELLAPDWIAGRVEVTLAPGVRLEGNPSLYGANHCSFNVKLGPKEAVGLLDHWRHRPPDTMARYLMTTRPGGAKQRFKMSARHVRVDIDGTRSEHGGADVEASASAPGSHVLEFKGPLFDARFNLDAVVTRTSL